MCRDRRRDREYRKQQREYRQKAEHDNDCIRLRYEYHKLSAGHESGDAAAFLRARKCDMHDDGKVKGKAHHHTVKKMLAVLIMYGIILSTGVGYNLDDCASATAQNHGVHVGAKTILEWEREYRTRGGVWDVDARGRWDRRWILNNEDIKIKATKWIKTQVWVNANKQYRSHRGVPPHERDGYMAKKKPCDKKKAIIAARAK